MNKYTFIFILFLTTCFSAHCQIDKRANTPEDLGNYVFTMLQKLDTTSETVFIYNLMTIKELKLFIKRYSENTKSSIKDEINKIDIKEYNERVTREYNRLKEQATKYKIKWSAIEHEKFEFTEKQEEGFTGIKGRLFFRHNGSLYRVKVEAFKIEDKYVPIIVRQLIKSEED